MTEEHYEDGVYDDPLAEAPATFADAPGAISEAYEQDYNYHADFPLPADVPDSEDGLPLHSDRDFDFDSGLDPHHGGRPGSEALTEKDDVEGAASAGGRHDVLSTPNGAGDSDYKTVPDFDSPYVGDSDSPSEHASGAYVGAYGDSAPAPPTGTSPALAADDEAVDNDVLDYSGVLLFPLVVAFGLLATTHTYRVHDIEPLLD